MRVSGLLTLALAAVALEARSIAQTASPPPPRAYAPPGTVGPPPPVVAVRAKSGFLALPYIGVASHRGDEGSGLGPGFVIGSLLGGRINPMFSINGEIRIDVLNPKNVPSGEDVTAVEVDLALSPLYHVPITSGEIVVGPKIGLFGGAAKGSFGGQSASAWVSGLSLGLNGGAFFDVSPQVALGGMLSFTLRDPHKECQTLPGSSEICDSSTDFTSEKVLALHAGALF